MYKTNTLILSTIVVFSLLIMPAGMVKAQNDFVEPSPPSSECPPYDLLLAQGRDSLNSLPVECRKIYRTSILDQNIKQERGNIVPTAIGGPDVFGYTFDDTVAYSWISATTNSGLIGDDGYSGPVSIGFDFPFYGLTQTDLYFSTNGLITFDSGYEYWGGNPLLMGPPNNLIAPFWEDFVVGVYGNTGAIYTLQGGIAPNRYFVIEWRNVETFSGSSLFSVEAILHENGDIVFQYASLPEYYYSTVGIKNSLGDDGLEYQVGDTGLSAPKAVRFYYPTTPTARVLMSPTTTGTFAHPGQASGLELTIYNTGNMGADTYDLTVSSSWPVTLYASDGVTALTDTDTDTIIDTGSIPQGSFVNIVAKFDIPVSANTGDKNTAVITATSSLNLATSKSADLHLAVPAPFVNVFEDGADNAMSFMTVRKNETNIYKATSDYYDGNDVAVTGLKNGYYIYLWTKNSSTGGYGLSDVEYAFINKDGVIVRPVSKFTSNTSTATTMVYDWSPSVAVAPNGTIGIVWERYLYNTYTLQSNSNIYFATLDGTGNLLTGPTNITNNSTWGSYSDYDFPQYSEPTIASTDNNRFILGWRTRIREPYLNYTSNVWYAVRDTANAIVSVPASLTYDNNSRGGLFNSLTGGKVIATWSTAYSGGPRYAVINSNGFISKPEANLNGDNLYGSIDAVSLPNGKVAVAWSTFTGVQFSILDSNYNIESGPSSATNPDSEPLLFLQSNFSITTDSSSNVIMTWATGQNPYLLYALGDSSGSFITQPMPYKSISDYIETSWNGQGVAPYLTFGDVPIDHPYYDEIEILYANGLTAGCSATPLMFCPDTILDRAQSAVFMLRGNFGTGYTPPAAPWDLFADDWSSAAWAEKWAEGMYNAGMTAGCSTDPLMFCPYDQLPNLQAAIFGLRLKYGTVYTPPAATGTVFADMTDAGFWGTKWAEAAYAEGIMPSCGTDVGTGKPLFCPNELVDRGFAAWIIVTAKELITPLPEKVEIRWFVGLGTGTDPIQIEAQE